MEYQVALMPGDGIGPEITEATLQVLSAIQQVYPIHLDIVRVDGGDLCAKKHGDPLPPKTVTSIQQSQTCLKGPVGETAADVIVKLRILFDLYAGIRPIKSYPNTPALHDDIDILFVRENTEGLYKGLEFAIDPDTMVCMRVITRRASRRIAEYAFHAAHLRGKAKKVTVIHKSNVMRKTDGLFAQTCRDVGTNYPSIQIEEMYVDAAAMQLIKSPHAFDVIVTTNMFGDILSDEASVLIGGLGMAPGANIGDRFALFEPIHGTAPMIAGKGVANPTSMILASSLMFNWLGHTYSDTDCLHASHRIETAIKTTLQQGVFTQDLGGDVRTQDFGAAVATHIMNG
jgi:3-isopropylmalate dehydrogenase